MAFPIPDGVGGRAILKPGPGQDRAGEIRNGPADDARPSYGEELTHGVELQKVPEDQRDEQSHDHDPNRQLLT